MLVGCMMPPILLEAISIDRSCMPQYSKPLINEEDFSVSELSRDLLVKHKLIFIVYGTLISISIFSGLFWKDQQYKLSEKVQNNTIEYEDFLWEMLFLTMHYFAPRVLYNISQVLFAKAIGDEAHKYSVKATAHSLKYGESLLVRDQVRNSRDVEKQLYNSISDFFTKLIVEVIPDFMILLVALSINISRIPQLRAPIFSLLFVYFSLDFIFLKRTNNASHECLANGNALTKASTDIFDKTLATVLVNGLENKSFTEIESRMSAYNSSMVSAKKIAGELAILKSLTISTALYWAAYSLKVNSPSFFAFGCSLYLLITGPLTRLTGNATAMSKSLSDTRSLITNLNRLKYNQMTDEEVNHVLSMHDITEVTLVVKDLCYKNVFNNLNLEIKFGEKVFLEGPNGCGKSTLFQLILCLLSPDSGEIFLRTKDNHEFHCNFFNKKVIRHLIALASQTPSSDNLSGGQSKMAELKRIITTDARIVFLDESSSFLDKGKQEIFRKLLGQLNDRTIVATTHIPEEVEYFKSLGYRQISLSPVEKENTTAATFYSSR